MAKETEKKQKPKRPTAQKRDIQNEKKRLENRMFKSSVRTAVRALESSLEKKEKVLIDEKLNAVYSLMDKGVKKGIYKLNKCSRTKSRLAARAAAAVA